MTAKHEAEKEFIPLPVRAWIYRIITALLPILSMYGLITDAQAPLFIALAGAILATGTAVAYTPRKEA